MKTRRERFIILPFTIGCKSPSSVAVEAGDGKGGSTTAPTTSQSKKLSTESSRSTHVARRQKGGHGSSGEQKTKGGHGFLAVPKANISSGVDKLIKSLKSFSQLFDMILYKEEIEEMEVEMEIGFPTDVKHVSHIGLDGTTTTNPVKGWENLMPPEIITFPSISLRQFELAMAAQAEIGNNGNNNHRLNPSRFS